MAKAKTTDPRREARMAALQSLFAADIKGDLGNTTLEWLSEENTLKEDSVNFADMLVKGVAGTRPFLDSLIQLHAPAWPVEQLALVDRNILRIALFELLHTPKVPHKTAINEAVELAKTFGSGSSARFVNGVLGSVMEKVETGELLVSSGAPAPSAEPTAE